MSVVSTKNHKLKNKADGFLHTFPNMKEILYDTES